jgi:RHS repeat-associated protein
MLYDAWGNVRASSADVGKYRFTSAELDTASGLYHMGARFYDPSVGRWLSEDPVQNRFEPVSLNFYAYVENNPLLLIDQAGTMFEGAGSNTCDASCRNDERQREVKALLDRLRAASVAAGITLSESDLQMIAGGVLFAATMAADQLAQQMPTPMRKQFIIALYWQSGVFFGVGAFSETLRLAFTRGNQNLKRAIREAATSPIIEISVGLFAIGAYLDNKYFGMGVLGGVLP